MRGAGVERYRLYPNPSAKRKRSWLTPHGLRAGLISQVRLICGDDIVAAQMAGCSEENLPCYTRLMRARVLEVSRSLFLSA